MFVYIWSLHLSFVIRLFQKLSSRCFQKLSSLQLITLLNGFFISLATRMTAVLVPSSSGNISNNTHAFPPHSFSITICNRLWVRVHVIPFLWESATKVNVDKRCYQYYVHCQRYHSVKRSTGFWISLWTISVTIPTSYIKGFNTVWSFSFIDCWI